MRVRRTSFWINEYKTSEVLLDEDGLNAMITFTEDDPLIFEQIFMSKK